MTHQIQCYITFLYLCIVGEQHICPSSLMMVEYVGFYRIYVLNPIAQCNKALASLLIR
jgi:hypothetical protein